VFRSAPPACLVHQVFENVGGAARVRFLLVGFRVLAGRGTPGEGTEQQVQPPMPSGLSDTGVHVGDRGHEGRWALLCLP
jgi:hypothetical protein